MKPNKLSQKQQKALSALLDQFYESALTYEASENSEDLKVISATKKEILEFLQSSSSFALQNEIIELSDQIDVFITQLSLDSTKYFTDNDNELVNTVTATISKIEGSTAAQT